MTIVGGNGTVGRVLAGGLAGEGYEVTVLDLKEPDDKQAVRFIRVDATDYNEVVKSIPAQTNALINLLAVKPSGDLLDRQEFAKMTDIFLKRHIRFCGRRRSSACRKWYLPAATM